MSFPYNTVLLIGATSGIGLTMADKLVQSGKKVIVVGRRADRLEAFVRKHGTSKAGALPFDITNTAAVPDFVKTATTTYPDIDCVFLNAAQQHYYDFTKPDQLDLAGFHAEIAVNFSAYVTVTHAFLPYLMAKKEPTSLIYTGTHLAVIPALNVPAYSASKAALNSFIFSLRAQLSSIPGNKIKVIEISPPAVQSELHDRWMGEDKGRAFGMPVDAFVDEAYSGLASGKEEIYVGAIGIPEKFMELVAKRRELFEWLSQMIQKSAKEH